MTEGDQAVEMDREILFISLSSVVYTLKMIKEGESLLFSFFFSKPFPFLMNKKMSKKPLCKPSMCFQTFTYFNKVPYKLIGVKAEEMRLVFLYLSTSGWDMSACTKERFSVSSD